MKAHPAAEIFPMMQEDELRRLADDIEQNGQYEPILVTEDGLILDGRNRAAACALAGIDVKEEKWPGNPGTEFEFVFSKNIHRRHLNESQRALAAALAAPMVKGKGIRLSGKRVVNLPPDRRAKTAEILGALFGVSEKTVRYAIQISGSNVLREAVQSGKYKVSAVSRLVKFSPEVQRQKLDEWATAKVRTPAATPERVASPSVPYFVVALSDPEFQMNRDHRPNLASDATVVIIADPLRIGEAVALLASWKVAITDVRCEHGAFERSTICLFGVGQPEMRDESTFTTGLGVLLAAIDGSVTSEISPGPEPSDHSGLSIAGGDFVPADFQTEFGEPASRRDTQAEIGSRLVGPVTRTPVYACQEDDTAPAMILVPGNCPEGGDDDDDPF